MTKCQFKTITSVACGAPIEAKAKAAVIAAILCVSVSPVRADENPLSFSIPAKSTKQDPSQEKPRCFPLRNVGIAETAKHYHASCKQDESVNEDSKDIEVEK